MPVTEQSGQISDLRAFRWPAGGQDALRGVAYARSYVVEESKEPLTQEWLRRLRRSAARGSGG